MSFSVVHTQTYSSTADTTTFIGYLFNTYINGKTHWTVSAHPSGDSDKFSVQLALPTPFQSGDHISYMWVTTTTSSWTWYDDATYTTTPGDLGTDGTNNRSSSGSFASVTGDWRIWESDVDSNAWFVTKGKWVYLMWPGCSKSFGVNDSNWDGSYDNKGTSIWPYIGSSDYTMHLMNFPVYSGTSSSEGRILPSISYSSTSDVGLGASLIHSFGWVAASSYNPDQYSVPILNAGPSDILWYTRFTPSSNARYFLYNSWTLVYDTAATKYYLMGTSDVNKQALAFDMGSSEPSFS